MTSDQPTYATPLADVRVVELSTFVAAPSACSALAQLGADVIKVEPPGGDPTRRMVSPVRPDAIASGFLANNLGKRCVVIDLKSDEGSALARRLIATADVVVENNRPGVMERLGLPVPALLEEYPGLIWISVRGFGPEGEWREKPAIDQIIQAASGMVSITGFPEGEGVKAGYQVVDQTAGFITAGVVLAALLQRSRGPISAADRQHVIALFDVALGTQATTFADYLVTDEVPARLGNASLLNAPSETLRSSDGAVMMAAYLPEHWRRLCACLGCPELIDDPRFRERLDRIRNRRELIAELEKHTAHFSTEELAALLEDAGVMTSIVRSYEDVATCEQVVANELLLEATTTQGDTYRVVRHPLDRFRATNTTLADVGQHTSEVLLELGFDSDEIDGLQQAGVVELHEVPR